MWCTLFWCDPPFNQLCWNTCSMNLYSHCELADTSSPSNGRKIMNNIKSHDISQIILCSNCTSRLRKTCYDRYCTVCNMMNLHISLEVQLQSYDTVSYHSFQDVFLFKEWLDSGSLFCEFAHFHFDLGSIWRFGAKTWLKIRQNCCDESGHVRLRSHGMWLFCWELLWFERCGHLLTYFFGGVGVMEI